MAHIKNQHTYRLKNYQGSTALDLAANDSKHSVVGFRPHYGSNQAWIFQQDDDQDGWFIKCSRTGEYLGIEGNVRNGTRVIAVPSPFKWDVRDSDVESAEGIRILVHGTNFSLDLSYGNSESHTRIQLWRSWPGPNQIWALTERVSIEAEHAYSLRNCQRGTAVNLSGDDDHSIDGYRPHDDYSQAWIFQQDDDQDGWSIKSSRTGEYLGVEGDVRNGVRVVAVPSAFKWDVRDTDNEIVEGIMILVHGTNFSLELDDGHSANHAKIQLWECWSGLNQIWVFTERVSTDDRYTYSPRNRQGGTGDRDTGSKILPITTTVREALIMGDLSTAEKLLTQDINADSNDYTSYSHRSFIMARQHDWDHALQDAIKSISIQPSLTGYISKGFALCGTGHVRGARAAFDVASMYTDQNLQNTHFLLLIKAIALYGADQHEEADLLLEELAIGCLNANTRACHIAEAYLRVQLGVKASEGKHHSEAAEHFTTAVNCSALSSTLGTHDVYEDLIVLLGWDLKSLWLTAHQKRCDALLLAGRPQDAVKSYRFMMDTSDITKDSCLDWSNAFTKECSTPLLTDGDAALSANNYDRAIELYSAVIKLDCTSYVVFTNRSKANLGKALWEDALRDAQKVIELNPSSYVGYQLSHAALLGAQRYEKAIDAFTTMLSKLDDAPEAQIRDLRQQYVNPSKAEDEIERAVGTELENAPLRLLNTFTGFLCNRAAQRNAFKTSPEYNELISFPTKDSNHRTEHIKDIVAKYFRCVLLSHRWEKTEALLHDIQDKVVYELNGHDGIAKLQSFCKVARNAGFRWAWMDTCCIDKKDHTEVQKSINSMFVWYRHSALTIVYLCDVPPSSQPGALTRSVWNERGWTFQELVAPKVVIFYQKDWSLYLGDLSPNHKESTDIMEELKDGTGIDAQALKTFHAGMNGAREKLQWAAKRVVTEQEDVAYSLFGIFGITLPVIYGENKQNALGRLLQEIVARSGDITVLDWIGQSSEFNSCLPAHITSYTTPPRILASLSEDDIHTKVSSLRQIMPTDLALKIYNQLEELRAPRFANCRLHLPCISFRVTQVRRRSDLAQETPITYDIKADGLHDLPITVKETLVQFLRTKPARQTLLLVRPWDRHLLADYAEQLDFTDDTESIGDETEPNSPMGNSQMDESDKSSGGLPVEEERGSRALRLMVRLQQPFDAFLLVQQGVGEYKRVASDYNIVAQIKDIASVYHMDVGTVEIL